MNRLHMQIDVALDYVRIEGYLIMRPSRISRSSWLAYWEAQRGF